MDTLNVCALIAQGATILTAIAVCLLAVFDSGRMPR